MTEKHKDRMVNFAVSLVVSVSCVFMAASLQSKAADEKEIKDALKLKADTEQVDGQIEGLKKSDLLLKNYVDDQNKTQDAVWNQRLAERDKVNKIILEELNYIRRRVDKIPTK